jgi:restriction system protein
MGPSWAGSVSVLSKQTSTPMAIPTYDQFIPPLLLFLSEQTGPIQPKAAYSALATRVGLTAEEMAELLPSGKQPVYMNRIGWAHDALKRSLLSTSPQRGTWFLTDAGRKLAKKFPHGIPPEEANRIANAARRESIATIIGGGPNPGTGPVTVNPPIESPEEKIENGMKELRGSVASELLELIGRSTPAFFERLVLDLLYAMGYGESREALSHVGGSGDGGIDGIISLDRLGLEKVYVQAKKWKGQVGSPEIQGFVGALQLKGADKGVLITSGSISGPAQEAARQAKGGVVLIDGPRLANLMIENGVGVSNRTLKMPQIDSDYFEAE